MEVSQSFAENYEVVEGPEEISSLFESDVDQVFSIYEPEDEESLLIPNLEEAFLEKHDDRTIKGLGRKYDKDGKRLRSSGSDKREDKDMEKFFKGIANKKRQTISSLFLQDGLEEAEDIMKGVKNKALPISEQLWEDEDLEDNEPNWKKFSQEYRKIPDDSEEKEYVISILTDRDRKTARDDWEFGLRRHR